MSLLNSILHEAVLPGAKIEVDLGGAVISIAAGFSKRISFDCPHPEEDLAKFHCWAVRPPSIAESAVLEVRSGAGDDSTLGYVFPVNTFSLDSEYSASRLDGRFRQIFASVAGIALCKGGVANSNVEMNYDEMSDNLPLREVFSDDLAVVVLGAENIERAGCSLAAARLLLQEFGYFVIDNSPAHMLKRPRPVLPGTTARVGAVSLELLDSCQTIERLISLASGQASSVSALLIYYQVIEIMSEKLLLARLQNIAAEPQQSGYAFKKKLSKIGSEQTRVSLLCHMASSGSDADSFVQLKESGEKFITHCGLKPGKSSGKVLYGVRNIIVHSQAAMDDHAHDLLSDFISDLHASVCSMVRKFNGSFISPEDDVADDE